MITLVQRGDPTAASDSGDQSWPPDDMAHRVTRTCDECNSSFFVSASHMAGLCPECAHYLYGYPNCAHDLVAGRCQKCGWDGSTSPFIASLKADARR